MGRAERNEGEGKADGTELGKGRGRVFGLLYNSLCT